MLNDYPLSTRIAVSDLPRARAWYEEKLGLIPERDEPMDQGLWYRTGGSWFFVYVSRFAGTAKNTVGGWEVRDLRGLMAELRGRGVVFNDYDFGEIKTVDGVIELGGYMAAWFTDPDGNTFELAQTPGTS